MAPARFDVSKLAPMLADFHARLSSVVIENLTYADCMQRYDRSSTLFYLDPPYWLSEKYYGKDLFTRDDFECLRKILKGINGVFVMSLNDLPEVRDKFADFYIKGLATTYSINTNGKQKASELLISNRPLDMNSKKSSLFEPRACATP